MEFGKVHDQAKLDEINWDLPQEDPLTRGFLKSKASSQTAVWMGAPAWNHKEWVGKIYPEKTKASEYLHHYSRFFNTIELNTTHYRIPTPEQTEKWTSQVPGDFLFCPKIFQGISHERAGLLDKELLKVWSAFLSNLGPHCGPCFMQLPPHFQYNDKALLFQFLKNWSDEFPLALEFRHPSWFQDGVILPALTQYLQSRNLGLVITDVAGRRDVLHSSISASFTMVRFIGNELHSSDFTRAQKWHQRLKSWSDQGLSDVFFFVHEPDDISVPEMADYFTQMDFFKPVSLRRNAQHVKREAEAQSNYSLFHDSK